MFNLLLAQTNDTPTTSTTREASRWVKWLTETVTEFWSEQGAGLLLNVILALVVFFIGRWAAGVITRICQGLMAKARVDETLRRFLSNIVYAGLLVLVVIAALDRLGVDTTSFAAVLAAAGLAVGLALQSSLSNFASGVMLILFQPFRLGDFVEAGGTKGIVEEIHIFHTIMRTGDNLQIIVPNGQITGDTITNYSTKPTRRIDLEIGCGYDDDLQKVKAYLEEVVRQDSRILPEPEPVVAVGSLGDSSVNFVVRPWVANADYWQTRWDLIEQIKVGFDEKGFSIPFPQRDVHVHNVAG